MRVVTAEEMKKLDQTAIKEYKVPGLVLMENAGRQVVEVIRKVLGNVRGKVITVFVGKGNNGGDGFVIARHLLNMGAEVKVLAIAELDEITGDAATNLNIWRKMGQKVYSLQHGDGINIVRLVLMNTDLIVDAIYGTGFRGKMVEKTGRIVEVLNGSGKPIVAVDIPSGLEADTGKASGPCIQAAHTVTFALPKLGLILEPGADYAGELHVVDISIPAVLIEKEAPQRYLITGEMIKEWLSPRPSDAHKGNFGRVLVVAGSRGMTGAACLVGEAALRAGAGLVTVAVPESLHDIMESKLTEVMTVPLPDTGKGHLSRGARQNILSLLDNADVLALGPGLSTVPEVVAMVRELLPSVRIPCVIDADGLNALAGEVEILRKIQAPVVITPHPGEMARLMDVTTREIQEDRLSIAGKAATIWNVVALLKGARTVVAAPDGAIYINPTGNPGMATGGSGDVLTGVVAALIAQGLNPAQAASAGAYVHGLAGDMGARIKGMIGLTAGDILFNLPAAMMNVVGTD
ncbi:MAG: Bifunctional NAD(P)H-hydrate repair enzyme Nnr [Pelotomaculum sp. PtaB.Bin013]|uniref:Bifunctional NAD(P)H-hydrate repair enzyme n=1 Tax=Pelotomaculum isophthalicicum JI TaxID=947010 RepID=A0A9X4GYQ1_9FIRM|nr:NAD(P)H-hydrate dehydratase [Pelotomaculum isophthalicicum]MDF9408017.1 NAD(P)H-hydrate dehydratase [Pelotomaculum isophthalicicum JI]OPX90379.1 MAG: Bifunctional NAD(P)H-hydrate repair enzyme Nnr [Pelotomaculum sp. PtaB.Bin013]